MSHSSKLKVMVDSNVFDQMIKLDKPALDIVKERVEFYIAPIQKKEIWRMGDNKIDSKQKEQKIKEKEAIKKLMAELNVHEIPVESLCWDIEGAGWGGAKWNDGDEHIIDSLVSKKRTSENQLNDYDDALIAEAAQKNGLTLITSDGDGKKNKLKKKAQKIGIPTLNLSELIQSILPLPLRERSREPQVRAGEGYI